MRSGPASGCDRTWSGGEAPCYTEAAVRLNALLCVCVCACVCACVCMQPRHVRQVSIKQSDPRQLYPLPTTSSNAATLAHMCGATAQPLTCGFGLQAYV